MWLSIWREGCRCSSKAQKGRGLLAGVGMVLLRVLGSVQSGNAALILLTEPHNKALKALSVLINFGLNNHNPNPKFE